MSHGQCDATLSGGYRMSKRQTRDTAASIKARLLNYAKRNSEAFDLVLVRFALERLLYRLSKSRHRDGFVVKGAILFQVWSNLMHRPTRDLDLLAAGPPTIETFIDIFRELCAQPVEDDGLVFAADTVTATRIKEEEEYEGIRMRFEANLSSARIPIQVDLGFGDAVTPNALPLVFPSILELPAPELLSYPRETVVAEKFQAMVMLGIANSRMKDFFDLLTLCSQFEFDGELVRRAIQATFKRRKTNIPTSLPLALTEEFSQDQQKSMQWNAFLKKSGLGEENLSLSELAGRLAAFLMPPARAADLETSFDMFWKPAEGWTDRA